MTTVTTLRNPALDTQTIGEYSNAVQTIMHEQTWLLGDDLSSMITIAEDLRVLAQIITTGLRDDLDIRTEATRLIRIVEKRASRDYENHLLDAQLIDFIVLYHPDGFGPARDVSEYLQA